MVYLKITDRYDMTSSVNRGHKAIINQTEETMKTDIVFLVCLKLNVPVNNFSVMLGRSPRFLGITSTFFFGGGGGGVDMSCSRTQHGDPSGARTPDLWILSPRC